MMDNQTYLLGYVYDPTGKFGPPQRNKKPARGGLMQDLVELGRIELSTS